jgi:hypothetical protein
MALEFGWIQVNGDYVPGLKRIFIPAKNADGRRTSRFAGPMRDISLSILQVEHEHGMGIGPQEFRHRSLRHDNDFVRLVRRASVMGIQGATIRWKAAKQGQRHEELFFQSE